MGDFNARVGPARLGEDEVIGENGWSWEAVHEVETPNRELLLEFCLGTGLVISNTYIQCPLDRKVTFREAGVLSHSQVTLSAHNIIDFFLLIACVSGTCLC